MERRPLPRRERSTGNALSGSDPDARALLDGGLEQLALPVPEPTREALLELADLLATWSGRMNLTGHRTPVAIVGRLILDALAMSQALPAASRLVDLGSGAGVPGLPLALRWPERSVVLVESRERRHHFQRAAIRWLRLRNVTALRGRAEALAPQPSDLVIAQAVAAPDAALALARPWTEPRGWIALPGSDRSTGPREIPDWIGEAETRAYQVPCGGPARTLWLGRTRSASG